MSGVALARARAQSALVLRAMLRVCPSAHATGHLGKQPFSLFFLPLLPQPSVVLLSQLLQLRTRRRALALPVPAVQSE